MFRILNANDVSPHDIIGLRVFRPVCYNVSERFGTNLTNPCNIENMITHTVKIKCGTAYRVASVLGGSGILHLL
jgi:hypothetical protein